MNRMSYIENLLDNFYIKHVPIPMKTKRCKMKQGCCSVTFCPLVPSWATTIHKFQGFEARFDRNDQFHYLIIDPGDIKTEQQQPGILYVAMSRAKTMGNMTNDCEIIGDLAYLVSPLCLLSPIIWIRESSNGTLVLSYMFAYGFKTPTRGFSLIQ